MTPFPALAATGVHETAIAALFEGRVAFDGQAPEFDAPLYVLGFVNRCGSNLLAEYLRRHPGLWGFGEALHHDVVRTQAERHGLSSFPDYVRHLARGARPGAALGVKASVDQLRMLLRWRVDRMFPELRIVHLQRLDLAGQAVSRLIASQTLLWTSEQAAKGGRAAEPQYDFQQLMGTARDAVESNAALALMVEAAGLPCLRLSYEELTSDPTAAVRRVLRWAGLPADGYEAPPPRLRKQADTTSEEFRARLARDLLAAMEPGNAPPRAEARWPGRRARTGR